MSSEVSIWPFFGFLFISIDYFFFHVCYNMCAFIPESGRLLVQPISCNPSLLSSHNIYPAFMTSSAHQK